MIDTEWLKKRTSERKQRGLRDRVSVEKKTQPEWVGNSKSKVIQWTSTKKEEERNGQMKVKKQTKMLYKRGKKRRTEWVTANE